LPLPGARHAPSKAAGISADGQASFPGTSARPTQSPEEERAANDAAAAALELLIPDLPPLAGEVLEPAAPPAAAGGPVARLAPDELQLLQALADGHAREFVDLIAGAWSQLEPSKFGRLADRLADAGLLAKEWPAERESIKDEKPLLRILPAGRLAIAGPACPGPELAGSQAGPSAAPMRAAAADCRWIRGFFG